MACSSPKCNFVQKNVETMEIKEFAKNVEPEIEIVGEQDENMLPLCEADCPKCEHKKAYYWLIQTRAGDEPETKFLRCEKCKHTWRDYS